MSNKESVVFINQSAGYLMIDIINAHQQYKERTLITGGLVTRNKALHNAVKIEKIIAYNRTSSIKRIFTWVWGFVQILWLVKTKYKKSDLFIVTNPPFAVFIPLFCKNRFSLLVYDIYPDALISYKYFKAGSFFARSWKKANQKIFKKGQHIFTISNGMKKVLGQYTDENKVTVVPVWADNNFFKPVEKKDNVFIDKYKLQHKFLVIYSGNLGLTHSIESLVGVADAVKDSDIQFIIIGEGEKKKLIADLITKHQLSNCMLLPLQDVTMLPYSLSAADLAVITLGKEASGLSIPSKTFSLMSAGAALLCIAPKGSELSELVNDLGIGKCFDPDETAQMVNFITVVKSDSEYHKTMQENALKASKSFGPENAFKFVAP